MAKFNVHVTWTETATRSKDLLVTVTKAEVVESLDLRGEERTEWRDHVEDYLLDIGAECLLDDANGAVQVKTLSEDDGDVEVDDPTIDSVEG